jgi:hypothetical protein
LSSEKDDMELTMQNALLLNSLDALLSRHPFGNSNYIHEQLHICYKRRLHKISAHLPAAGQLLNTLGRTDAFTQYRVIGDTVVRCAVQHALRQIETRAPYGLPLEQCEEVFQATIQHLEEGRCGPLGSGLTNRLGTESYYGWIWSEERSNDVFARFFWHVVQDNYGETQLCTLGSDELAMLAKGARLLRELLPLSSRSALSHAHLIAVFTPVGAWATRGSSSQFRLSGTFFLNRARLSSPWWVAEQLFHEALHQQLYDFRHGHSLLVPTYGEQEGAKVCSLWNLPNSSRSNYWDTDRVFAAFHVYVHLALLCTLAEQRAPESSDIYGPLYGMTRSRDALGRAYYLAEQLRAVCWQELGLAGRHAVDWFSSVLDVLDLSPPPQGSYVHLLIDRYRKEAKEINNHLSKNRRPSDISRQLIILAKEEARIARSVLVAVNAEADCSRLDDALAQFSDQEPGAHFARIRGLISETILDASPGGYGWKPEAGSPDEMVKQMIESSSATLMQLLTKESDLSVQGIDSGTQERPQDQIC